MALYYRLRRRKILFFIIIPLLILTTFIYFFLQISPTFIKLSEDKIYAITTQIITETIEKQLEEVDTATLVDYKYDINGKIVAVNANIVTMNKLNNKINQEISKKLDTIETILIELPLGSLISNSFLSGIGPKFPIQIVLLNNVNTQYHTEFTSTGINQTRHRIFINVMCNMGILSNIVKTEQEINVQIPIVETIIVGNVPNTYFDFDNQ